MKTEVSFSIALVASNPYQSLLVLNQYLSGFRYPSTVNCLHLNAVTLSIYFKWLFATDNSRYWTLPTALTSWKHITNWIYGCEHEGIKSPTNNRMRRALPKVFLERQSRVKICMTYLICSKKIHLFTVNITMTSLFTFLCQITNDNETYQCSSELITSKQSSGATKRYGHLKLLMF